MRIGGIAVHAAVTAESVIAACERRRTTLDSPGFCIACGADAEGVEPDARRYRCEACGDLQVYGAEELLIRMA